MREASIVAHALMAAAGGGLVLIPSYLIYKLVKPALISTYCRLIETNPEQAMKVLEKINDILKIK